jgi:hypothetical protein
VVDERGGRYADDLYLVMSDNRNGTPASSNADIFLFKSTDGGSSWVGPTRVDDDRSVAPPDRDDLAGTGNFGQRPVVAVGRHRPRRSRAATATCVRSRRSSSRHAPGQAMGARQR